MLSLTRKPKHHHAQITAWLFIIISGILMPTISFSAAPIAGFGTALSFDGTDDYVSANLATTVTNNMTMEAWINWNGTAGNKYLFNNGNSSSSGYGLKISSSNTLDLVCGGVAIPSSNQTLPANEWHHVAIVRNNGTWNLYLDGIAFSFTSNPTPNTPSGIMSIGSTNGGTSNFPGLIDEVRIWNTVRTQTEIQANMYTSLQGTESGLVAYYDFEDGTGTTLTDKTANNNNGTLSNMNNSDWVNGIIGSLNFTIDEDNPLNDILGGYDGDGDALTFSIVDNPSNGSVSITDTSTGAFTYTPNTNYNGTDSFTYKVTANSEDSNTATVTINITAVDDTPVAGFSTALDFDGVNDYVDIGNDSSLQITGNNITLEALVYIDAFQNEVFKGSIINKEELSSFGYTLRVGGNGQIDTDLGFTSNKYMLSPANIVIINKWYHIAMTYNGQQYKLYVDGVEIQSKSSNFTITNNQASLQIGASSPYSDRCFDGKIDEVRIWNITRSQAEIQANMYTALLGTETGLVAYYNFEDGTGTTLTDKTTNSNNGTLTNMDNSDWIITDNPINPVFVINEDTDLSDILPASDGDGDALTYSIVSNPTNGSVSLTDASTGAFTYTPNANYNGTDSFTYKVTANSQDSNIATVNITINSIADIPVADDITFTTNEDTLLIEMLSATDGDGDSLTYSIIDNPVNGNAFINNANVGVFSYNPNISFNGSDSFTYKVNDGSSDSNIATVTINVTSINDAPSFTSHPVTAVYEDINYTYNITTADIEQDAVTITAPSIANWLTFTDNGDGTAQLTGIPTENDIGNHSITLTVDDSINTAIQQNFTITVNAVNNAPVAGFGDTLEFDGNDDYVSVPSGIDIANQSFTIEAWVKRDSIGNNHTIIGQGSNLPYQGIYLGFSDEDHFFCHFVDNAFETTTTYTDNHWHHWACTFDATTNKRILYQDGIEVAQSASSTASYQGSGILTIGQTAHTGSDNFDGQIDEVRIWNVVRTQETIQADRYKTFFGNEFGLVAYYPFEEGIGITVTDKTGEHHGTLTNMNDADWIESDLALKFIMSEGQSITGRLPAIDIDSTQLTYSIINPPTKGILPGFPNKTGNFSYTPNAGENGIDSFAYQVSDGTSHSNTVVVNITLTGVNEPPSFTANELPTVNEDAGAQIIVSWVTRFNPGTGESAQSIAYIVDNVIDESELFATIPTVSAAGNLTYTLNPNAFGIATFDVKIQDNGGTDNGGIDTSEAQTFTLTVTEIADTPTVTSASTEEGVQSTEGLVISRNQADGKEVTHFKITNIEQGLLFQNDGITPITSNEFITVAQGNSGLKFTPSSVNNGQFDIQASTANDDSGLGGEIITAVINIGLINEPPQLTLDCISTTELCTLKCETEESSLPEPEQPSTELLPENETLPMRCTMKQLFGGLVELVASATDSDVPEQNLRFSLIDAPVGAFINPLTGQFEWQPTQPGEFTLNVIVTDDGTNPDNLTDSHEITLTLTNDPILKPIVDQNVPLNNLLSFTAQAQHHNPFTFSLVSALDGATLDPDTGVFSWIPTEEGNFTTTIRVTESGGLFAEETFIINVELNQPPVLAPIDPMSVLPNSIINFTVLATDPNDNILNYRLANAPSGATIHPLTGEFTWIPTQTGNFPVTIEVVETDGQPTNLKDREIITIYVNDKPIILPILPQTVGINRPLTLVVNAIHAENHPLIYTLKNAPTGATIDPETGQFTWTPDAEGDYEITVQVSENTDNLSSEATIKLTVSNNTPPELTPVENDVIPLNRLFLLQVEAMDAQDNQLLYQLNEAPEGTVLHPLNGQLTWIPNEVGTYGFKFTITEIDGIPINLTVTEEFELTVNTHPAIDKMESQSINMGNILTYQVTAFHPLGNPLGFRLLNPPAGASINPESGLFSWNPSKAGIYDIQIQVFDKTDDTFNDIEVITLTANEVTTRLILQLSSNTILTNGPLNVTGSLFREVDTSVTLEGIEIDLTILGPDQTWNLETQTLPDGTFQFTDLPTFDIEGDYLFQANFYGNRVFSESQSEQQPLIVRDMAGYAILIQGRTADDEDGVASYNKTMNRIYQKMKQRGFKDEDLEYFNFNTNQSNIGIEVDAEPSIAAIQAAFNAMQARINAAPAPLFIVMVDHGGIDGSFYIDKGNGASIKPNNVSQWMNNLESGLNAEALAQPRVVVIGSCYAGAFIPPVSKEGRIVIASATADEESFKGPKEPDETRSGEFFTEAFFAQLARGKSIRTAFELATETTETLTRQSTGVYANNRFQDGAAQHPLLDDNGDKIGNNILSTGVGDGINSEDIYLGSGPNLDGNSANSPAEILLVTDTLYLDATTSIGELFAVVNNASRVKDNQVIVDIRTPSVSVVSEGTEATSAAELDLMRMFLSPSGEPNRFSGGLDVFQEQGKYEVMYLAVDAQTGEMSPFQRSIVYKNRPGNRPPQAFELQQPAHESEPETTLIFSWDKTFDPDADPFSYTFLIATDPDFNKVVYKKEELLLSMLYLDNNTRINDPLKESGLGLRDGTDYYWQVEAIDPYGARALSEAFLFTTNNTNAPPGIGSVFVSSALDFNSVDSAQLVFLDGAAPDIQQDQGNYNMLLPPGRRRAVIKADGFEDEEVVIDNSEGLALLQVTLQPKGGIPLRPGKLQFTIDNTTVAEDKKTVNVLVKRVEGSDGEITVNYACVAETATENSDYTCPEGNLTWASQDSLSKRITLDILNDPAVETDESFNLMLSNPTGGAKLLTRQMTVTIVDDDLLATSERGKLQFTSDNYTANEAEGRLLTLQVNRTGGSDGEVSVQYTTTTDSTAISGLDYTGGNGILSWADGDSTPKTLKITLINDGETENAEQLRLMLFNPIGDAQLGLPFQTTLTINDSTGQLLEGEKQSDGQLGDNQSQAQLGESQSESQGEGQLEEGQNEGQNEGQSQGQNEGPTLKFLAQTYLTHETIGQLTTFTVIRTGEPTGTVSVQYRVMADSTAILDQDYIGGSGTLVWADGDNIPQSIDLTLLDDEDSEGPETIVLELYDPRSNISLGTPSQSTLIITDDETLPQIETSENEMESSESDIQTDTQPETETETETEPDTLIQFTDNHYTVTEGDGTIEFPVERLGNRQGEALVQYLVLSGTAIADLDYLDNRFGTLTWGDGDDEIKKISLSLIDDQVIEDTENVHIVLLNQTSNTFLPQMAELELTILDNDQEQPIFLPSLGQSVIIQLDNDTRTESSTEIQHKAAFRGGASVNALDYQTRLFMSPTQYVNIVGEIQIDSQHIGQVADILIVVAVLSTNGQIELFVMRDTQSDIQIWDGEDMNGLVPALENVTLGETQRVDIYQGLLSNGHLLVFFGYRLKESGLIAYNGEQPIDIQIENEVLAQPHDVVWQADFTSDGEQIVTASNDGNLRIWNVETGDRLALLKDHTQAVTSMAFNSVSTQIVTASDDGTARLWDMDFPAKLTQFTGHTSRVESALFSADAEKIVTASQDGTARVWEADTGQPFSILKGHQGGVNLATFNADATQIVTTSQDNTARLWEAEKGETLATFKHDHVVEHAAFRPDGKLVVTASWDGTARVWEAEKNGEMLSTLKHDNGVSYATFSPDGSLIVTTSWDNTARIWEAEKTRTNAKSILIGHQGVVNYAAFSPDGQQLVTASSDGTAWLWEVETGHPLAVFKGHTNNVGYAAFSPDGERVVTASWDNSARVWDVQTGELLMILRD
jgi:WD40 repeat protein